MAGVFAGRGAQAAEVLPGDSVKYLSIVSLAAKVQARIVAIVQHCMDIAPKKDKGRLKAQHLA
eukprot:7727610-Lingulodinium_polyedra.AAC.1